MENENFDDLVIFSIPENDNFSMIADENNSTPQVIEEDFSDDALLKNLLREFQMESVYGYLKSSQVTFKSLQFMQKEDVKEAIPPLGLRMEFREKLFAWKKREFGIDDETLSMTSKVGEWLKNSKATFSTPTSSVNLGSPGKLLDKGLVSLLNESLSGKDILEFYALHEALTNDKRDDLIRIIIEEIVRKDLALRAQDFTILLNEMCEIFPTEYQVKDYYYIARMGEKNPSGKLFSKYRNKRSKKAKLTSASLSTSSVDASSSLLEKVTEIGSIQNSEVDESVAAAYKLSLNRDCANWEEVCQKWKLTHSMRQKDVKTMESLEFLRNWSKLNHSRAPELIKIDFQIMYPGKDELLLSTQLKS